MKRGLATAGEFIDALTGTIEGTLTLTSNGHDYSIKHYISESSHSLSIVLWVDWLKDLFPTWNGAYCVYNRAINFLAYPLPSSAPAKDFLITFSSNDIHIMNIGWKQ